MEVGDLVRWREGYSHSYISHVETGDVGTVVLVDSESQRQTTVDVLFVGGLASKIWINHLEVIDV